VLAIDFEHGGFVAVLFGLQGEVGAVKIKAQGGIHAQGAAGTHQQQHFVERLRLHRQGTRLVERATPVQNAARTLPIEGDAIGPGHGQLRPQRQRLLQALGQASEPAGPGQQDVLVHPHPPIDWLCFKADGVKGRCGAAGPVADEDR